MPGAKPFWELYSLSASNIDDNALTDVIPEPKNGLKIKESNSGWVEAVLPKVMSTIHNFAWSKFQILKGKLTVSIQWKELQAELWAGSPHTIEPMCLKAISSIGMEVQFMMEDCDDDDDDNGVT